jgi:hypothetical protein
MIFFFFVGFYFLWVWGNLYLFFPVGSEIWILGNLDFGILGKFISFFSGGVGNLDFGKFGFWDFGKFGFWDFGKIWILGFWDFGIGNSHQE